MNRTNDLIESIQLFDKISWVDDIYIIDFSSDIPIEKNLLPSIDKPLNIFRIENEQRWWLGRAYNAGFNIIKSDYILKLDADALIKIDSFNELNYCEHELIVFTNNQNDKGNFIIKKQLLDSVNGFNEYIKHWGYDDIDLINRISNTEASVAYKKNYINKIIHGNQVRVPLSQYISFQHDDEKFNYAILKSYNNCNSFIAQNTDWNKSCLLDYNIYDNVLDILHTYSVESLSFVKKLKIKFIFLKTFFSVYYLKDKKIQNKIRKKILPFIYSIFPKPYLKNKYGLDIYLS